MSARSPGPARPSEAVPSSTSALALGGLLLLPLIASASLRDLWAPDEPRYAEVAREIVEGGDALVMHLAGRLYPDKPPLLFWIVGLLGTLGGWSGIAMRAVSVAATAGSALLVGRLAGEERANRRLAPLLFLSLALVVELGGRLQFDPLLAFLCLAAIERLARPAPGRSDLLAAGLFAGLAALTKGPVAWAVVALALIGRRLAGGRTPAAPAADAPEGARHGWGTWTMVGLLAIAPVGLWAVLATLAEPALFHDLFWGQHVERALKGTQHGAPFWKHALTMPVWLLPWTPAVLLGLADAWRVRKLAASERSDADFALLRAAGWLVALFLFFSILPPKRDLYLLPAYPAAAIVAAHAITRRLRGGGLAGPAGAAIVWTPVGLFALLGLGLVGASSLVRDELSTGGNGVLVRAILAGTICLAVAAWAAQAARGRRTSAGGASAITRGLVLSGVATASAFALLYPAVNSMKSARPIAEFLAARPERPDEIPCLGVKPEGYRFYGSFVGEVPTVAVASLEEWRDHMAGRPLGLIRRKLYARLTEEQRAHFHLLREEQVGSREVLVLLNQDAAPAGD